MTESTYQRLLTTTCLLCCATLTFAQKENIRAIADSYHLSAYLVAALLISIFVMIFYNRLYLYREQEINQQAKLLNMQLALALDSNKTQVWTFDTVKRIYSLLSREDGTTTDYTPIDFSQFFNHDDFAAMRKRLFAVRDGESESETVLMRGKSAADGSQQRKLYEINISVLKRDGHDHPRILLGTQRDITANKEREENARNLSLRYHTAFNSSLVDMVYYDKDGIMTDINDKACETFAVSDRAQLLASKPSITDVPAMQGIDFHTMEQMHSSSITDLGTIDNPIGGLDENYWGNKIYYEQIMSPLRNHAGQLTGIVMAGRNITEMVQSQHYQQWASMQLAKTTQEIQAYIDNINYSLRISGVRLINYYPDTHELEISNDLNQTQYRLTQIRCASLVHPQDRRRAKGLFIRMDRHRPGNILETFHTLLRDSQGRDVHLTFSMIPVANKDGHITHYFGMSRDDTEMKYTEMQLREETEKAQETEELKNTFLLNMSYEIRTPLNGVLGFAELFNGPHDEADEPVFAEEIKRNTGELLALINDILFISRLDAHMVEFNYQVQDFARLFDGYCYMGWSQLSPGVKVKVENPYSSLMVKIDDQNLGQVIQKLCANAAHFTKEGTIRAKCEYRHGELNISIEDTGQGISQEMMPHVYDRFVRDERNEHCGTGLDLSIAKELVEQMGGTIELQSEKQKGTTAYVIIPCEMTAIEKKTEYID